MANNYLQPVNDHFDIDKFSDVDDDLFLKNTRTRDQKPQRSTNPFDNLDEEELSTTSSLAAQRQAYAEKRRELEQRTLDSTQKSLGMYVYTQMFLLCQGAFMLTVKSFIQFCSMKPKMLARQQPLS